VATNALSLKIKNSRASCKKPQEEQPQKGTKKHKKEKEEVNLFLYKEI